MNRKLIHKIDMETTNIENKLSGIGKTIKSPRIGVTVGFLSILTGVSLGIGAVWGVNEWFRTNELVFRTPIIVQVPIYAQKRKQITKVEKVVVREQPYSDEYEEAYDTVWLNESGRGTNKSGLNGYCIAKGQLNEIGYYPQGKYCFSDRKEQKETFMLWLSNRLNHIKQPYCNSINECLGVYNNNSYTLADK